MRDWFVKYALAVAPLAAAAKHEAGAVAGQVARKAVPPPLPAAARSNLRVLQGGKAAPAAATAAPRTAIHPATERAAAMPLGLEQGPHGAARPTAAAQSHAAPPAPDPGVASSRTGDLHGQQNEAYARGQQQFSQRMNTMPPGQDPMLVEHPGMSGINQSNVSPELKSRLERQKMMQEAKGGVQPQRAITPAQSVGGGMYSHGDEGVFSSSPQMYKAAALWLVQNGITKLAALSFFHELRSLAEAA